MKKRVIIIGGGFAGLQLAKNIKHYDLEIYLIDKLNHHQFQPLFYQVASSRLEPSNISFPFRKIFQNEKNIHIRLAKVTGINSKKQYIETTIGNFNYNYLIIATGCHTNFFGNPDFIKNTLPMKTTYDAITIRNRILLNFEKLIRCSEEEKAYLYNIIIVGGGATGVELSGAFAEMKKSILPRDYPELDFSKLSIYVIESSNHTLNNLGDEAKHASEKYLIELGVTLKLGTNLKSYDGNTALLSSGEEIKTRNVIWTAGVIGNKIEGLENALVLKNNRYKVNRYNQVIGYDNIYAIGDIAYMETPKYPNGHPQVANVAINQGKNLANNIKRILSNKSLNEYEYKDLGHMATIGKHKAVVEFPFLQFHGYFAWFIWMFLHLMLILSVRNKLGVFFNWAWNYFNKDSSLRLILKEQK